MEFQSRGPESYIEKNDECGIISNWIAGARVSTPMNNGYFGLAMPFDAPKESYQVPASLEGYYMDGDVGCKKVHRISKME